MPKVMFLPEGKDVDLEAGITIMEAAEKASVFINSLCGGNGVCGKCRVQVKNGKVRADKNSISYLSKEEIKDGYILACQTTISDDMEILIPPESRLESEQILMDEPDVDYSQPEKHYVTRVPDDPLTLFEPLTQKIYLELDEPSSQDNMGDAERIMGGLRQETDYQSFDITLGCLRSLATVLRENNWKVTVTIARYCDQWRITDIEAGNTSHNNYGLAIDIGTTTVVVQLVHMKSGNVVSVEGSHNLQARYGEDVISRMIYACSRDGLNPLHQAVIGNINKLIETLAHEKQIDKENITSIVAAGNTTMSHLLLSLMPCSIRLDPYVPTARNFPQVRAGELGIDIKPEGMVETIACASSYVGGDIVAGIIACGIADRPEIKVLIDIGTNGEIVVGNNEWLVCCSASAGPAFEGGGTTSGMRAMRGAIERIKIENRKVDYQTIGKAKPIGICGSG
ncbi:MAG: DUF4445 domain-containing protein, partial [Deltaproteobacteria bacterium]|nr:DUF4445 domain-containing protein [Deltaproteobacteria bacterium]